MTRLFKKYPFLTALGFLAITQLSWFWAEPVNFKTVWSKNPVVAHIIREHYLVQEKSKIVTISYYLPYFPYFADIVAGTEQPKKELMESYYLGRPYIFHTYYQNTVDLFPENGTTHFLLGFCEHYMGNEDIAQMQFEESAKLEPYFFWSYYNLGVIYFQQGSFYKCVVVLTQALSLRNEIALEILHQDSLFGQIWRHVDNPSQVLERNLDEGKTDAMLLLAACFVKGGGYAQALKIMQSPGFNSTWHQELSAQLYKKVMTKQGATGDIDRLIQEEIPVRLF